MYWSVVSQDCNTFNDEDYVPEAYSRPEETAVPDEETSWKPALASHRPLPDEER